LTQVFGNLLNNACKYTEPGGEISLRAHRDGDDVVVVVRDAGIGIAPDMLTQVFEMFTQVDHSLGRSQGGLGIGLTLVRRLVEMHGGTVSAQSEGLGRGSEFVVRLPASRTKTEAAPAPRQPGAFHLLPRHRILVVDDNQDAARSLSMLLKCAGHEVQTVYDGLAAVEAAREFQPDVVLLDIGLPGLNGYEACRRIRQLAPGGNVIVIALTGWGQDEDRQKSSDAGFDGHLVKPVEFGALVKLIASHPSAGNQSPP
jgi:CheY-like chemotaxis protein